MTAARCIIMLGTSYATMGGIASAVMLLRDSRLFRDWPVRYLATHCDGSAVRKIAVAMRALCAYLPLLATGGVMLVHAHVASYASFWRKLMFLTPAFAARIPVVFHLHGADFMEFWEGGGALRRRLIRWTLMRSAVVVALSDSWRDNLRTIAPQANIAVIPNPVAAVTFPPRFRRPGRLLFLGRIGERKGSYVLLEALAILKPKHPQVRLLCGGDGEHQRFLHRARQLGVADNVQLIGWVRGAAKARHLARAAVFVLPSFSEGLPMALLEAMAAGAPVITTPVGGIPELIRDGVDGLLVPPGDPHSLAAAIARTLDDEPYRLLLAGSAHERVTTRYSVSTVVDRIDDVYMQLGLQRSARTGAVSPA